MYVETTRKEKRAMQKWDKKIDELIRIVHKLIELALELGTLIAVIKMILESIR